MEGLELHRREEPAQPSTQPRTEIDTQRGRYALAWLIDQGGTADLHTWATHLAAWEENEALCEVPEERWMHYYTWLYFALVPRLVQENLVEHYSDVVWPETDVERIGEYLVDLSSGTR